jgi:Domain of unknown function (DUF4321)
MPPRGSSNRRPVFHAVTLAIGFIVGGAMTQVTRRFLPAGTVKQFFTTAVTPSVGPVTLDLVILKFSLGPVALDVSLLSLLGVLIAYLIARSLF